MQYYNVWDIFINIYKENTELYIHIVIKMCASANPHSCQDG